MDRLPTPGLVAPGLLASIAVLTVGASAIACGTRTGQRSIEAGDAGDVDAGETDARENDAGVVDARATAPPFVVQALTRAGIGSEGSTGWANIGRVFADVDWKDGPFTRAMLLVDLETTCYPFETWAANPPPAGQNWPADCDAFDRSFDVFIDDAVVPTGAPPYEVIHAITPFGGPEHLEVDITDLANALPGRHRLRVDLVSFSDAAGAVTGSNAGWTVSARIEVTPGPQSRRVLAAIPLFAGRMESADPWPVVSFDVPPGTVGGRLEYRTSGHGQAPMGPRCVGPAEEFCDRRHQIYVDGVQVQDIDPYREDCGTLCTLSHYGSVGSGFDYCLENPAGLPASVRAPRANWCPGSMTPPYSWQDIPALASPGPHTFSFQISQITDGGNWLVSAIYYAYGS